MHLAILVLVESAQNNPLTFSPSILKFKTCSSEMEGVVDIVGYKEKKKFSLLPFSSPTQTNIKMKISSRPYEAS
jgi:hypothetical protein